MKTADYWSDEAEEFLLQHFGPDVHRRLGYESADAAPTWTNLIRQPKAA